MNISDKIDDSRDGLFISRKDVTDA